MYEVALALYEQPGRPREAALRRWHTSHAGLVYRVPGVRKYLQGGTFLGEGTAPFLGIATLAFDDEAAFGESRLAGVCRCDRRRRQLC